MKLTTSRLPNQLSLFIDGSATMQISSAELLSCAGFDPKTESVMILLQFVPNSATLFSIVWDTSDIPDKLLRQD